MMKKWLGLFGMVCLSLVLLSCSTDSTPIFNLISSAVPEEAGSVTPATGEYDSGTLVQITATPNEHWLFDRWQGGYSGTDNPVNLTINRDISISAIFVKRDYPLTIHTDGEGEINERIVQAKTTDYPHGTVVELTANPDDGWVFIEWQGDLEGNDNPATITVEEASEVTAIFRSIVELLPMEIEGKGDTNIVQQTAEENPSRTQLQLIANPDDGWVFIEWQGDLEGNDNPLTIIVEEVSEVTAVFKSIDELLSIETVGDGEVEIVQQSAQENPSRTQLQLTAIPEQWWEFVEWQQDFEGDQNPAIITLQSETTIKALFQRIEYTIETSSEGQGSVTVTPEKEIYYAGEEITFTANPDTDWKFVYWLEDIENTDNPFVIILEQNISLTAVFDDSPFDGGIGSLSHPYQVSTIEQLQAINNYTNSIFIQTNDIDASDTENWNGGKGFRPIGDSVVKFVGQYDGQGYKISELTINRDDEPNVGLFGYIEKSKIKNLGLENVSISGENYVGGIAGYSEEGKIINSYSTGTISGKYDIGGLVGYNGRLSEISNSSTSGDVTGSESRIGGLVGHHEEASINNSHSSANVTAGYSGGGLVGNSSLSQIVNSFASGNVSVTTAEAGGLVGYNESLIKDSYASGQVTGYDNRVGGLVGVNAYDAQIRKSFASGTVSGMDKVGGLVGKNWETAEIFESFATGNVTGDKHVGGLVGLNTESLVLNSYASGTVTGDIEVGGLVGVNQDNGKISVSYAHGSVTGNIDFGGLIGLNGATIEYSYWDNETSGQNDGIGRGPSGGATGLSTSQMTGISAEANMSEFNWQDIWITTTGYPILRWQSE